MHNYRPTFRAVATGLMFSLTFMALPVRASVAAATLSGSIVWSADGTPAAGVKLHANDSRTGLLYTSMPSGDDGGFMLPDLPPSIYELAIESPDGLYRVTTPLKLDPGSARIVNLSIRRLVPGDAQQAVGGDGAKSSMGDNPLITGLALLGVVVVVGLVLDDNSSSGAPPSLSMP